MSEELKVDGEKKPEAANKSSTSGDHWAIVILRWLVAPAKFVLGPWWEKVVADRAETATVKEKLLEAIVRFRVRDFCRQQAQDEDREAGLSARILERLRPTVGKYATDDLAKEPFLSLVEREVELAGIRLELWALLACLSSVGVFNAKMAIVVEFTGASGNQSHQARMIASFQQSFVFTPVFIFPELNLAQLSPRATQLLKEYCSRSILPMLTFEICEQVPFGGSFGQFLNPTRLPEGWKPQ